MRSQVLNRVIITNTSWILTFQRPSDGEKQREQPGADQNDPLTSQPRWQSQQMPNRVMVSELVRERVPSAPPFYTAPLSPNQICGLAHNTPTHTAVGTHYSQRVALPEHTPFSQNRKKPLWTVWYDLLILKIDSSKTIQAWQSATKRVVSMLKCRVT